jgi:hypothetical protein
MMNLQQLQQQCHHPWQQQTCSSSSRRKQTRLDSLAWPHPHQQQQ